MSKRMPTLNLPSDIVLALVQANPEIAVQIAKNAEQAFFQKAMDGIVRPHFERSVKQALANKVSGFDLDAAAKQALSQAVERYADKAAIHSVGKQLTMDLETRFAEMFDKAIADIMPKIVEKSVREVVSRLRSI